MSKLNVKAIFDSRWGADGVLIEADYSQLEVYALAVLSGDEQLKKDLLSGIDLHLVRAHELFSKIPFSVYEIAYKNGDRTVVQQRRIAKGLSFQLQYGSGAVNMAKTNNVPIETAKKFIENYYARYPAVKRYQDTLIVRVKNNRVKSEYKTTKGYPAGKATIKSITGRRYTFTEMDSFNEGEVSFLPTQIKNYAVQGTATGDIVIMVLGILFRTLKSDPILKDSCLLINTIHDSIMFDCKKEVLDYALTKIKSIMEQAPTFCEERLGFKFDLPLPVKVKHGPTWDSVK